MDSTAILIPAMRPHLWAGLIINIEATTPEPHSVWWAVGNPEHREALYRMRQPHVLLDEGASWGIRLNAMFRACTEPYVFTGAEDVRFHDGWLTAAMGVMAELDGVVSVCDLYNPQGTTALVSRNYIDTMSGCADTPGVIIYPGYRHSYSDTELFNTARVRGKLAHCHESIVEHMHWGAGKAPYDEVYAMGERAMASDLQLHISRGHLWNAQPPEPDRQLRAM